MWVHLYIAFILLKGLNQIGCTYNYESKVELIWICLFVVIICGSDDFNIMIHTWMNKAKFESPLMQSTYLLHILFNNVKKSDNL